MPDDHLVLVLPGSGYGADGPVLMLPAIALEQLGARAEIVAYPNWRPEGPDGAISDVAFRDAVVAAVRELIDEGAPPSRVTFVAKSLGTLLVALDGEAMAAGVGTVEAIWLTPTFGVEAIRDAVIARGWRSLVVSGDADRWFDREAMETVVAAVGGETLTIEGADHSLIIDGDVLATVEGLRRLAETVLRFAG